ncbi:hypothetical protein RND71_006327 [Anisodus tanguticus]|uniref:Uncharacterized protein n=1 Tax=Anisodus tanguticus TaxID=243964 RepID=A0AAE1STQ8_9SOLA|nr:hypothetical protein RND71_006327 [Anisodus tanguticus]
MKLRITYHNQEISYIQRVFRSGPLHPQPRTVFATDLHSQGFLQLPIPVEVDFRTSSTFGEAQKQDPSASDQRRKTLDLNR